MAIVEVMPRLNAARENIDELLILLKFEKCVNGPTKAFKGSSNRCPAGPVFETSAVDYGRVENQAHRGRQ